jgi:hypothetical protein
VVYDVFRGAAKNRINSHSEAGAWCAAPADLCPSAKRRVRRLSSSAAWLHLPTLGFVVVFEIRIALPQRVCHQSLESPNVIAAVIVMI